MWEEFCELGQTIPPVSAEVTVEEEIESLSPAMKDSEDGQASTERLPPWQAAFLVPTQGCKELREMGRQSSKAAADRGKLQTRTECRQLKGLLMCPKLINPCKLFFSSKLYTNYCYKVCKEISCLFVHPTDSLNTNCSVPGAKVNIFLVLFRILSPRPDCRKHPTSASHWKGRVRQVTQIVLSLTTVEKINTAQLRAQAVAPQAWGCKFDP